VLSRGKLTTATVSYYTDTVARGIDDYYSGRGEAPGRWIGRGAVAEDLVGEVAAEDVARLFTTGVHPRSGHSLGGGYQVRGDADKVLGWDLTFSAPKSVSLIWALAGGEVGMAVRDAHDAAVAAGLAYLEDHAAFARAGKAGIRQVDTDGLIGTAFVHRSSRAGDPQLHTHVLVSGRVRCSGDGVWRALDSRALHRELKPAGMVYQAALRAELTARLGVVWEPVSRHGQADIAGVPEAARRAFSKRTAAVEARAGELIAEAEVELGRPLTDAGRRRIFKVAVLETRQAKTSPGVDELGLHDLWRAEAAAAGVHPDRWMNDVLDRPLRPRPVEVDTAVDEIVADLEGDRSTWSRRDVVRAAARRAPVGAGDAATVRSWIEHVADRVLDHDTVVALTPPEPETPALLRRRDGMSVYEHHGAARYTTEATLSVEQRVLDIAIGGRDAGRGVADAQVLARVLAVSGLSDDQADAVRAVSLDGDTVACVVGPAGAGKSRMLDAAVTAWIDTGIPVRGLTVSAAAAGVLAGEAGIDADTIARFLHEQDRRDGPRPGWQLRIGEVVVVDEASMVASGDLARLVFLANGRGGKVVLVGDWAQLGAVEAGGLFRLLAAERAVELTGVRRFAAAWERDASLRLRNRDTAVISVYEEQGRILGGDRGAMVETAFAHWVQARTAGRSVVLCASDNDTVDELSRRCQAARMAVGEVDGELVGAGASAVGVGDEIVTCRNDRRLVTTGGGWVRNGDRWTVEAVHRDGSLTVADMAGRGRARLPSDYVTEHVSLGYAVTIHKAQGVTVDHAVVLVDEATSAEGLYVGMTRGRNSNTALVVTDGDAPDHGQDPTPPAPAQVLARALHRVTADRAALDKLRERFIASESLATLKPRLANLDRWIDHHAPPDRADAIEVLEARRERIATNRPGRLSRDGRELRRTLHILDQQIAQLRERQQHRVDWMADSADLLAYRAELADAVTRRRTELGHRALGEQPEHLVELLGPAPGDIEGRLRWHARASRIEAYREEWGIEPDELRTSPRDSIQYREWERAGFGALDLARRLEAPVVDHGRDLGIEL
jgi:conjugative relaxase-like TrwC/TraI family protein